MDEKKIYKINGDFELEMCLRRVLARGFYKAEFRRDADGNRICEIAVEPDTFRKLLAREYCEKRDKEDGWIHVTESENKNTFFLNSMMLIRPQMMEDGVVVIPDPEFEFLKLYQFSGQV